MSFADMFRALVGAMVAAFARQAYLVEQDHTPFGVMEHCS
jgi:hypothetical protein